MTNEEAIKRLENVKEKYERFVVLSFGFGSRLDINAIEFAIDSLKYNSKPIIKKDCIDVTFKEI